MKILYFDCFAGISGDMTIGAFLDAGVEEAYLREELKKLSLNGYRLEINKSKRSGICGTNFRVILENPCASSEKEEIDNSEEKTFSSHTHVHEPHHHEHTHSHHNGDSHCHGAKPHHHHHGHQHVHCHRSYADIKSMIQESSLSQEVKDTALAIFNRVAKAESAVHGVAEDEVHFHEVGAVDSIIDIVGAAICYHALKPDQVLTSAVNIGSGYVRCAHGVLGVPAPATIKIAAEKKIPLFSQYADKEAATPTGMAIVTELAQYSPQFPQMTVDAIGYGFGDYEFKILNGLRVIIGSSCE